MTKRLRRFLFLAVILLLAIIFIVGNAGRQPKAVRQLYDWGSRVLQAESLSEALSTFRYAFRKAGQKKFTEVSAGLLALEQKAPLFTLENLPDYEGRPFVVLYRNEPQFSSAFKAKENPYYSFTPLDSLGRCGAAYGKLGPEYLPTRPRGPIGMIKPTGWRYSKYDDIDKIYLYNRCHLLAFQLTGENANKLNLITGTRHFNVVGMLPFENRVADYIRRTGKHVYYRVTPVFKGKEMLARGVVMEALSAEDGGKAVRFHVFVYNVQPGIAINYADGTNHRK